MSTLLTIAGWIAVGFFALRVCGLGAIGADVRAYQLAYLVACAGHLMLALVLWQQRDRPRRRRDWLWWLAGALVLRLVLVGTQPGDDAYRYVWEGQVQLAGHNPFLIAPDDARLTDLRDDAIWTNINHPDYPAIYPPLAQVEFLFAAAIHPSIYTVKLLHVLWDVLCLVVLASCLRRGGRDPRWAMLYGLCPLVLSAFAVEGHIDSLMLLFALMTVWSAQRERWKLAGVMLGLGIAAKLILLVWLPWFVVRRPRAALLALVAVGIVYAPYLSSGFEVFTSLHRFAGTTTFFSFLATIGVTTFESEWHRALAAIALAIFVSLLVWRISDFTRFSAASVDGMLLAMPVVHYWYLALPLALSPLRVRWRWVIGGIAMVVYFEAEYARVLTNAWSMPVWSAQIFWGVVSVVWLVEVLIAWLAHRTRAGARLDIMEERAGRLS